MARKSSAPSSATPTSLEQEVNAFANALPYWARFLAEKILLNIPVAEEDYQTAFGYLLEDLTLTPPTEKTEIVIKQSEATEGVYKAGLLLAALSQVEGVNALTEQQILEFNPQLTIVYGANGSGKSGYVKLFKKAFYAKVPEDILPNIHLEEGHKPVHALFSFTSGNQSLSLHFPEEESNPAFEQFAVFDGKGASKHIDQKNEFEFRPAGLNFFASYMEALKKMEQLLSDAIAEKDTDNDFTQLFEGESAIKTFVESISGSTTIDDLNQYTPFSAADEAAKKNIEKVYDDLLLSTRGQAKEIQQLESIKWLLAENKAAAEKLNAGFSTEALNALHKAIEDCVEKEHIATSAGMDHFKTDKIAGIGTPAWKNFIASAEAFAALQPSAHYPEATDNCLFCHQPLSDPAQQLIASYRQFIKGTAEENVQHAREVLTAAKQRYAALNIDILPDGNLLTQWLSEKQPAVFASLKQSLAAQKTLAENICRDLDSKTINGHQPVSNDITLYATVSSFIEATIGMIRNNEQQQELDRLLTEKTFLVHKEKFNAHLSKLEAYVKDQLWAVTAGKANLNKRKITDTEKKLSDKYFNQQYVDAFNNECQALNGNLGIEINHTGSGGKSFRQLKIKGKVPNVILSEGEQKVIAMADFLAETHLSAINRGLIFDDPANALDEVRRSEVALRLVKEAAIKQVVIFTHDKAFVAALTGCAKDLGINHDCHLIENRNGHQPGTIHLKKMP